MFATRSAPRRDHFAVGAHPLPGRDLAGGADDAHQPLRQHGHDGRRDQVVLHAHIGEPGDRAGRVVGVQCGVNEVAGQGGTDGHIGGLAIADFTDHDHVRVLTHDVPQPGCEGQTDLRIDVDLVDPVHLIFDRVLDGDDLLVGLVDALQRRVERGALAAAGGAGDQKDTVRHGREMLHPPEHERIEAQVVQVVEVAGRAVEQAHDHAFAIQRGQRRDAQIDLAPQRLDLDAAVLRQPALGDVQAGHQLHAGDNRGFQFARRGLLLVQHAINAKADAKLPFEGLEVNVAGAPLHRGGDHGVDQADHRRLAGHIPQMLEVGGRLLAIAGQNRALLVGLAVVAFERVENLGLGRDLR